MKNLLLAAALIFTASCAKEKDEKTPLSTQQDLVSSKMFNIGQQVTVSGGTIGIKDRQQAQTHFDLVTEGREDEAIELRLKSDLILIPDGAQAVVIEEGQNLSRVVTNKDTVWVAKVLMN